MTLETLNTPPPPHAVNLDNHPCFNPKACRSHGRVHLPVAPSCNIQCNYCNRDFDCVNESRPGVTSTLLTPEQALVYLEQVMELRNDIAVVGIAGPGDPFANPDETMETFRLVRARFPEMILCLSTNGLGLTEEYVDELAALQVSHVTLTINAIDPEIAAKIYAWARHGKRMYRGREAGALMIDHQLKALGWIKASGMIAKVNSIIVPGINDHHLSTVARRVAEAGADLMNCIPLLPTHDTTFADLPEPDRDMRMMVRRECASHVNQMTHCARCRADAIGKLGDEMSDELTALIQSCAQLPRRPHEHRPYVAVATREGMLVNQHLGEADALTIYGPDPDHDGAFLALDQRATPARGSAGDRWSDLAETIHDCRAVLVSSVGSRPREVLAAAGLEIVQMEGMIEEGLRHVFQGETLPPSRLRVFEGCGHSCAGDGTGCG